MTVERNLRFVINFYKKHNLLIITWNEKYSSKQVAPISYTLEEVFLTAAIFERFVGRFFKQRVKKFAVHFGLY